MKGHGTHADDDVASKGDNEDGRVGEAHAVADVVEAEPDKGEVRQSVDELGTVSRDVVVLDMASAA